MEGVTGMIARLRHVPGCSRGGLYGPANIDFRFVGQADSYGCNEPNAEYGSTEEALEGYANYRVVSFSAWMTGASLLARDSSEGWIGVRRGTSKDALSKGVLPPPTAYYSSDLWGFQSFHMRG